LVLQDMWISVPQPFKQVSIMDSVSDVL
jgi:hypothetical protein